MMKFNYPNPVVLQSARSFQSAKGNVLTFCKIVDTSVITYDCEEFMLSKEIDVSSLQAGAKYNASLIIEGKYSNLFLTSVK